MRRYVSEEVNSNEVVELVIPDELEEGEYEVYIRVIDEHGFQGEIRKLKLKVKRPTRLRIYSPEDGAVVPPQPTFILSGEDKEPCKVRFVIEFHPLNSASERER